MLVFVRLAEAQDVAAVLVVFSPFLLAVVGGPAAVWAVELNGYALSSAEVDGAGGETLDAFGALTEGGDGGGGEGVEEVVLFEDELGFGGAAAEEGVGLGVIVVLLLGFGAAKKASEEGATLAGDKDEALLLD